MKLKPIYSLLMLLAFAISSCTMVKNPQSANFQRVKYNSHIKLAKNNKQEKLPKTVSSFEDDTKIEVKESEELANIEQKQYKPLLASNNVKALPKKATKVEVEDNDWEALEEKEKKQEKAAQPLLWNNKESNTKQAENNLSSYINTLEPMVVDGATGLGDILYVILVVLLILIVISLIAELAGGLVGALIAVLLILLILRLLGYV